MGFTQPKEKKPDLDCKGVTMIDPAAGWFEISPKHNDVKSITEEKIAE